MKQNLLQLLATRAPMSEETKKKISEALKKGGGAQKAAVNSIGGVMQQQYNSLENSISGAKEEYSKLPTSNDINNKFPLQKAAKGASKADKAKIKAANEQIKSQRKAEKEKVRMRKEQIKNEVKAKRAEQKKLRETAQAMKRVKAAEEKIAKAKLKSEKAAKVGDKIKAAALKARTPEQKQRVKDMEDRLKEQQSKLESYVAEQQKIISSNGAAQSKAGMFEFSENCLKLSEVVFSRELTKPEQRVAFTALNEEFDELEAELEEGINDIVLPEIERVSAQAEKVVSARDMVTGAVIGFYIYGKLKALIKDKYIQGYEFGKKQAAKEIDVSVPNTPLTETQWIDGEADRIATQIVNDLDTETQRSTQYGILKGVAAATVAAAIVTASNDKVKKYNTLIKGNIAGEAINEGRRETFQKNQGDIIAYQRSEILDSRTCNVCRDLDEKSVKADDPIAAVGQIHSNCRGIWIPIRTVDDPVKIGLPAKYERAMKPMFGGSIPIKNNILKALKNV